MARYVDIECDAVVEILPRRAFKTRDDIQDFLDNIPTADVQPVIYCKDCKYWHQCTSVQGICKHDCGLYTADYDDYCSNAERKGRR